MSRYRDTMNKRNEKQETVLAHGSARSRASLTSKPSTPDNLFSGEMIRAPPLSVSTGVTQKDETFVSAETANGSELPPHLPQVFTNVRAVLSSRVVTFLSLVRVRKLCDQFQIKLIQTEEPNVHVVTGIHRALVALEQHIRGLLSLHSQTAPFAAVFASELSLGSVPRLPMMGNRTSISHQPRVFDTEVRTLPQVSDLHQQVTTTSILSPSKWKCDRIVYEVVALTAQERLNQLQQECKVSISIDPASDSDKKSLCLLVAGNGPDCEISRGLQQLKGICSRVNDQLSKTKWEISTSVIPAVSRVNWKRMKTVMTFEGKELFLWGLKEDVDAASKILKRILRTLTTISGNEANSEAFILQGGHIVIAKEGNITREKVDVIVNAANRQLKHSGGVAKAICYAAGSRAFQKESTELVRRVREVKDGEAVVTGAGSLGCKKVVHAVAPQWSGHDDQQSHCVALLTKLCCTCLKLTDENRGESVAIPGLGSGNFGIPKLACAKALISGTDEYFRDRPTSGIRYVIFIDMDKATVGAFRSQCRKRFGCSIWESHDQFLSKTDTADIAVEDKMNGTAV